MACFGYMSNNKLKILNIGNKELVNEWINNSGKCPKDDAEIMVYDSGGIMEDNNVTTSFLSLVTNMLNTIALKGAQENYVNNIMDRIMYKWCNEARLTTPISYYMDYSNKEILIYTDRPGIMIGMHGELVDKYINIINYSIRIFRNYKLRFIELKGRFVNCQN